MEMKIDSKQCTKCKEEKALTEFSKHRHTKDRKQVYCKTCISNYHKATNGTLERKCGQAARMARFTAKKCGVESTLTREEATLTLSESHCFYCNEETPQEKRTLDHVLAFENGGTNTHDNVVMACLACNSAKKERPAYDFIMQKANRDATGRLLTALGERMELSAIEALRHLETQHTAYNEAQFMAKHYGDSAL